MALGGRIKCVATVRRGGLTAATIVAAVRAQFPVFDADVKAALAVLEPAVVTEWSIKGAPEVAKNTFEVYPKCALTFAAERMDEELWVRLRVARDAIRARLESLVGGQGWTQVGSTDIQLYGGA